MKWILGTLALLAIGLVLKLSLLVYAMYVLLGVLLLNRFFTRTWTEKIMATRRVTGEVFEIGETAEVTVEIENMGRSRFRGCSWKIRCRRKRWRRARGSRWQADACGWPAWPAKKPRP